MMAMSKSMLEHQEPGDIEALLPWYAAGTLPPRDSRRVADALARDPELAKQYAAVLEEYASTIELNESLGAPSAKAMQKLFAAIDAELARPAVSASPQTSQGIGARFAGYLAGLSPKVLAWSASVAGVALVLQAGLIGTIVAWGPGSVFETASYQPQADIAPAPRAEMAQPAAPAAPPAAPAQRAAPLTRSLGADIGPRVFVRFAPDARASEITALLDAYQASVIDSSKGGVFRLKVGAGAMSKQDQDRLIARLQNEAIVVMVLPAP